jgi:hypothetical protein
LIIGKKERQMKHAKWLLLVVLLASLVLGLAACGGDKESEPTSPPAEKSTEISLEEPTDEPTLEPTPEPTDAPTDTPPPEPTETAEVEEEEEEVLDPSSLSSAADLSSYRSTMSITMVVDNNGEEEEQTIEMIIEYTSEPPAQHIVMTGAIAGPEGEGGTVEMYLVEGTMYMRMEDQWLSMPATEEDIDSDAFITADAMLDDLCGWKKEGKDEIDGVDVVHWTFTKEDIEECLPPEDLEDMGQLTQATGDLYIAEEDNFVVLMEMSFEGEDLDMDLGDTDEGAKAVRMEIRYETTDVNEPFTIEVPEEATESSSVPDDIPVPEGATGVNNMFGMISFTAETPPQEVFDYFQEEMPNNGWTEANAEAMSGLWMLEYTKDGRTANIMISEDDSGNASVMITVADE